MSDDNGTPPEGSDDDTAFDELVKGQLNAEEDDGPVELSTLWEGIEYIWRKFNTGSVLVRGIVFAEYIDDEGKHSFKWQCSPEMPPWAALGMLHQAQLDVESDCVANNLVEMLVEQSDDEEDDEDLQ